MPWLTRVEVRKHFKARDFVADLTPGPGEAFRHLVLTGPNGSGKTTILEALYHKTRPWVNFDPGFQVDIDWIGPAASCGSFLLAPTRRFHSHGVSGPSALDHRHVNDAEVAPYLKQHLVNQHVQARLAQHDDPAAAVDIFAWLARFESGVAELFGVPGLKMEFVRQKYDIVFVEPSGLRYTFEQLPSGFSSVLHILAELALRIDATEFGQIEDLTGVVIIDEIDAFLHPALQERILPFLTGLYPRLQFVVSTHSPAVATSLRNAVVVALGAGRCYDGAELSGTPYGELLTTLFGLETDVDLQTTRELHELQDLSRKPTRTEAEQARLAELADALQKTGNPLALEVWIDLHADPEPESEATA